MSLLLESKASIHRRDYRDERLPLHEAAEKGHAAVVQVLLAAKSQTEWRDRTKVRGGSAARASRAGRRACSPAWPDPQETALHLAVRNSRTAVVEVLLKARADITVRNTNADRTSCARRQRHAHQRERGTDVGCSSQA